MEAIVSWKRVLEETTKATDIPKGMIGYTNLPTIDPSTGMIGTTSLPTIDPLARIIGMTSLPTIDPPARLIGIMSPPIEKLCKPKVA